MSVFSTLECTRRDEIVALVGKKQPTRDEIATAFSYTGGYDIHSINSILGDANVSRSHWMTHMTSESALETPRTLWIAREMLRFLSGYYSAPFALYSSAAVGDTNSGHASAGLSQLLAPWFVHVSKDDPTLLAYTPSDEYGIADRQVKMRPEALLRKLVPGITDVEIRDIAGDMKAESDSSFLVASTIEEVTEVYTTMAGDTGCMRHPADYYDQTVHPSAVYASPETGVTVAYLRNSSGRVSARCVIYTSPDGTDKRMVRVYGSLLLERKLLAAGYRYATLYGVQLPAVLARRGNDTRYAMPYLDAPRGSRRDDNVAGVSPIIADGQKRFLVEHYSDAEYNASSTSGYVCFDSHAFRDIATYRVTCAITGARIRRSRAVRLLGADGTLDFAGASAVANDSQFRRVFTTLDGEEIWCSRDMAAGTNNMRTRIYRMTDGYTQSVVPVVGDMSVYGSLKRLHSRYSYKYSIGETGVEYVQPSYALEAVHTVEVEVDGEKGHFLACDVAAIVKSVSFVYNYEECKTTVVPEIETIVYGPHGNAPRASSKRVTLKLHPFTKCYTMDFGGLDKFGKLLAPVDAPFVLASGSTGTLIDPDNLEDCGVVTMLEGTKGLANGGRCVFSVAGVTLYTDNDKRMGLTTYIAASNESVDVLSSRIAEVFKSRIDSFADNEAQRVERTTAVLRELSYKVAAACDMTIHGWSSDLQARTSALKDLNTRSRGIERYTADTKITDVYLAVAKAIRPDLFMEATEEQAA